jgi:sensor histidine kinase YesM
MKRLHEIFAHLGFWLFVIIIRLPMLNYSDNQPYYMWQLIVSIFLHILIFYLFYFFFGRILLRKHIWQFIVFFIAFLFVYSIPVTYFIIFVFDKLIQYQYIKEDPQQGGVLYTYISVITAQSIYAITGTLFCFTIDWFRNSRQRELLEKQNISNELALLRSQINPHFLFNTLNNIHAFVYRDQDKTAYGIIKLSEIMRYMLYETNSEKVLLEKELKYVQNYVDLQRLRMKDPDYVEITIEGNVYGKLIPPLLLITFIENAFKHGRKNSTPPGITVLLRAEANSMYFEVSNYISQKDYEEPTNYKGFGLRNLKRRLELMYGKDYQLDILKDTEKYTIRLRINNL